MVYFPARRNIHWPVVLLMACCLLGACGASQAKEAPPSLPILALTLPRNTQNASGTITGHVVAIDSVTGKQRWRNAVMVSEYDDLRATTTTVYLATSSTIQAFAIDTGKQLWRYQSPDATTSFRGFDAVTSTTLFATFVTADGTTAEYLAAFDAKTGQQRWSLHTGSDVRLVATAQTAYFVQGGASSDGTNTALPSALRAVSATDGGTPLWTNSKVTGAANLVLGADGTLYTNDDAGVMAIDATTGTTKWTFANPQLTANSIQGELGLTGTNLVVSFNGQLLLGLDASTGKKLWQQTFASAQDEATEYLACQPAKETALQLNLNNTSTVALKVYDTSTGQLNWQLSDKLPQLNEPADLTCDDQALYVSTTDAVSALKLQDGAILWQNKDYTIAARDQTTPWNGLVLINAVSNVGGALAALDAHTGTQRWQAILAEPLSIFWVVGEGITQT